MTRTVLGVWAHPDDEAYLCAGFLAAARAAGHRVVVATATRGEAGLTDPAAARIRAGELTASLAAIGVTEHRWLRAAVPLTDGCLDRVPEEVGVAAVAAVVADVRPDLVLTFGPDGMTGHDDHRAVSAWTTRAVEGTGAELWYAALTGEWLDEWGALCAETGVWMTGPPEPAADPAYASRLSGELLDAKIAALVAHRSQTAGLIALVGEPRYRDWWSTETFVAARTARAALEEEEAA
ncbi:PIG-L deacetylase family protein [Petropleomorpha daqingensis]|uniref:LmbE family N-acetylglucosaminyl deacetylase n=1 Tax=Petropleomorpha daqingensis TaxID=2026353 RepID=A0A853CKV1_9ACTN|nr:PIG-L deacetylase family protein [Petropleomorpha daqingensis]NYJ08390.1 LmbE family N-acetylglucosaminyl deacetylase [Petropleomorpha daqingensis]